MEINPIFDRNPNSHNAGNSIAHSEKINPKTIAESSEPPLHIHTLKMRILFLLPLAKRGWEGFLPPTLILNLLSDHFKDLVKHRSRQFTRLSVLLAGMISGHDRLAGWK